MLYSSPQICSLRYKKESLKQILQNLCRAGDTALLNTNAKRLLTAKSRFTQLRREKLRTFPFWPRKPGFPNVVTAPGQSCPASFRHFALNNAAGKIAKLCFSSLFAFLCLCSYNCSRNSESQESAVTRKRSPFWKENLARSRVPEGYKFVW